MLTKPSTGSSLKVDLRLDAGSAVLDAVPRLEAFLLKDGPLVELSRHPGWLNVLRQSFGHVPYCLEAIEGGHTRGFLSLAYVKSWLFGRYLVSLPYLNYGGVVADDEHIARLLIDRAIELADCLNVRRLELRHTHPTHCPRMAHARTDKAHMRLDLPSTAEALWKQIDAKARNQVKKARKNGLSVSWGGHELLPEFYAVFSRNMRDLGTPVYSRSLFAAALNQFPGRAELCVVRAGPLAVAGALLLHGWGVSEVPSASSLRSHNHTNANMLMYWHMLERSIQREQDVFDFGRSTPGSGPYKFKEQWGAQPAQAHWQSYLRFGSLEETRPDNPRYGRMIGLWKRLPVALTRLIGPRIVRGIP
jgi:FemAB-related protein (PEP-CTERM system-associated)